MSRPRQQTGKLPPESMLHERYLIIGQRGRGGMSVVYEAIDTEAAHQRVAIKEMSLSNIDDEYEQQVAVARFQQEAAILEGLAHPNLPRVHGAFSEGGRSYLVMDFIEGKTLFQLLRDHPGQPLPVSNVLYYISQLCDVLSYLHQQRPPIIFRDVKPTNIMVTSTGRIYLIDFGIARFFKEGQAHDTEYLGSRGYAAPEQHGLGQTTPRTDIYGLGSTLHHCLTGHDPFNSADPFVFVPVSQANAQVSPLLSSLIEQMTAFDEQKRPASMLEVKRVLSMITEQAADATTTLAGPASVNVRYRPVSEVPIPMVQAMGGSVYSIDARGVEHTVMFASAGVGHSVIGPAPKGFWHAGFVLLFVISSLVTLGGSILALAFFKPAEAVSTPGLELSLTLLFWLFCVLAYWITPGSLARSLLALNTIAAVCMALAIFTLESAEMQQRLSMVLSTGMPYMNIAQSLLSGGLLLAGISCLGWLLRPVNRLLQGLGLMLSISVFGSIFMLAWSDIHSVSWHASILLALVILLEGWLVAVHTARQPHRSSSIVAIPTQQLA